MFILFFSLSILIYQTISQRNFNIFGNKNINSPSANLGACFPPMLDKSSACEWNCGDGIFNRPCSGIYYCGVNSTSCRMNCLTEKGCDKSIILLSKSSGDTVVNCLASTSNSVCRRLAINCGDFNTKTMATLQRNGFVQFNEIMRSYLSNINNNFFLRRNFRSISDFYNKANEFGNYKKCELNCGGNGDSCDEAMLSCFGKFETGCSVNVRNIYSIQSRQTYGHSFKQGGLFCDIKNINGHTGNCLLNCPIGGPTGTRMGDIPCVESRFGCKNSFLYGSGANFNRLHPKGYTQGKCYCNGHICSHHNRVFISNVILNQLPPAPTLRPTAEPTTNPTTHPTPYPSVNPTRKTVSPTGHPVVPTAPTAPTAPTTTTTPKKKIPVNKLTTRATLVTKSKANLANILKPFGIAKKITGSIDIFDKAAKKTLIGSTNQVNCNSIKCEFKCIGTKSCSKLIFNIGKKVLQFKLVCEGEKSCLNINLRSYATENQIECKGAKSCDKSIISLGYLDKKQMEVDSVTAVKKAEIKCENGSCMDKLTLLECGYDFAECKVQVSPSSTYKTTFGGNFNCFSDKNGCLMECSGLKTERACLNSKFNCVTPTKCKCINASPTSFKDCPAKINKL